MYLCHNVIVIGRHSDVLITFVQKYIPLIRQALVEAKLKEKSNVTESPRHNIISGLISTTAY